MTEMLHICHELMGYGGNTLNNSLGRPEIRIIKLRETIEQLGHQGKLQCSNPHSFPTFFSHWLPSLEQPLHNQSNLYLLFIGRVIDKQYHLWSPHKWISYAWLDSQVLINISSLISNRYWICTIYIHPTNKYPHQGSSSLFIWIVNWACTTLRPARFVCHGSVDYVSIDGIHHSVIVLNLPSLLPTTNFEGKVIEEALKELFLLVKENSVGG